MSVEEEIKAVKERQRELDMDVTLQLSQMQTQLRTERKLADDRHEMQMQRFDAIDAQLASIAAALGTNGSGGRHA